MLTILAVFGSGLLLFILLSGVHWGLCFLAGLRRHRKRVERRLLLLSLQREAEDMRAGRYSRTYPNIPKRYQRRLRN